MAQQAALFLRHPTKETDLSTNCTSPVSKRTVDSSEALALVISVVFFLLLKVNNREENERNFSNGEKSLIRSQITLYLFRRTSLFTVGLCCRGTTYSSHSEILWA